MNNTTLAEFFAAQIARCERSIARLEAELAALPPVGQQSWSTTRRIERGVEIVDYILGTREELGYWMRRASE